jgi:hypothetical protein
MSAFTELARQTIQGVALVAALNYGQVAPEIEAPP